MTNLLLLGVALVNVYHQYKVYGWWAPDFYFYSIQIAVLAVIWAYVLLFDQSAIPESAGRDMSDYQTLNRSIRVMSKVGSYALAGMQLLLIYVSALMFGVADGRWQVFFWLSLIILGLIVQVHKLSKRFEKLLEPKRGVAD